MAFAKSKNFNYGYPTPGPQSPTTNDVMNHVFFLTKEDWKEARETGKYDYIIIGSGFCGYAFAERVLRNEPEAKILVIERGNYFLPAHFQNLPLPYANLLLAGAAETFPWTLSNETRRGTYLQWQHGMIPFFGGRSILWSAWCPEPTREEMNGWPQETYEILRPAKGKGYFDSAHDLLNVTPADQIDKDVVANPQLLNLVQSKRPVYSNLQDSLYKRLAAVAPHKIGTIYRVEPARLAVGSKKDLSLDFYKYSVAAPILEIIKQYKDRKGQGVFHVVTDCVVSKIIHQAEPAVKPATEKEGTKEKKQKNPNQAKKPKAPAECVAKATALHTSRGVVPIGDQTKLIIAAGAIPSATLAMNSFPDLVEKHNFGKRLTAHFITAIVAKIPRDKFPGGDKISDLELAAVYVAGAKQEKKGEHEKSEVIHGLVGQYHIQLTALYDSQPESNADTGLRYMPDVVATASAEQLATSKGSVILVCAVLGEIDSRNTNNWIRINPHDPDPTSNITLQLTTNGLDKETWDRMDNDTFALIESITEGGAKDVTYWLQETSDKGYWLPQGESLKKHVNTYRVSGTVHEGSPLYLGTENDNSSPVNSKDYKLRGTDNVYVTGAGLWPESASWNPTMTMVGLAQHLADNLQKPPAQDTAPEGGDRAERQKDHRNHMYQRANEQQRSNGVTLGHYSFTGIGQAVERKQEF